MPRILVIDDDRVQRAVATQALTRAGHEVFEAADGQEGLEAARTGRPDLIVCDVVMPGMNGYQFVTALRQEEGIAGIGVIMLTSMAERAHVRVGMNAGADDYLAKPFSFEELNEAVAALLAKRRALQEGLISSMNTSFVTALEEQRESLAARYEARLVREVGARWDGQSKDDAELKFDHAVVLKAQVLGSLEQQSPTARGESSLVRRVFDALRDALLLFNAVQLLPAGKDVVAIYVDEPGSVRVRAAVRAVRASLGVLSALARLRGTDGHQLTASIALHGGPLTLLRMSDALHGGPASTLATGAAMQELDAIAEFARNSQWGIAASPAFVGELAGQLVTGRSAQLAGPQPHEVVEVLSLR